MKIKLKVTLINLEMKNISIFLDFEGTIFDGVNFFPQFNQFIESAAKRGNVNLSIITNSQTFSTQELTSKLTDHISNAYVKNSLKIIDASKVVISNLHKLIKDNQIHAIFALVSNNLFNDLKKEFNNSIKIYRPSDHEGITEQIAENINLKNDVDAILIGVDEENFSFCTISLAARYVIEKKAKFLVVGEDHQFRRGDNFMPGPYALATPVRTASYVDPYIIGKPNINSLKNNSEFSEILNMSTNSNEIWVIGDNIETDIKFAYELKAKSILVLTGVAKEEDLLKPEYQAFKPTFVCKDLKDAELRIFE